MCFNAVVASVWQIGSLLPGKSEKQFSAAFKNGKKYGTLHEFACHPCAGAMLIFSGGQIEKIVSFILKTNDIQISNFLKLKSSLPGSNLLGFFFFLAEMGVVLCSLQLQNPHVF